MLFSVRDVDVLRLLCWCQNIRPQDLNSISTKVERENLMALLDLVVSQAAVNDISSLTARIFTVSAAA